MTIQDKNTQNRNQIDYSKIAKTIELLSKGNHISVGDTPNDIVYETRLFRLLHYRSLVKKVYPTPILVVYALINRSYVLDLQPNKSWIRHLLTQGFDIYLLDWKSPTRMDKFVSFDDYVNSYIDDCVEIVQNNNSAERITLHGYCMGSSMSAMYTALHEEKIKNMVTIAPSLTLAKINCHCYIYGMDMITVSQWDLAPAKPYECYSLLTLPQVVTNTLIC